MLKINQILKVKPVFILAVDYNSGSLADMMGEHDRDDNSNNEYLADMTIQYNSLVDNACLSFTIECLVSVNDDNQVIIEEMDTSSDSRAVYVNNVKDLPNGGHQVWDYKLDDELHATLLDLIESQPINDIPEYFTIESY